MAGIAEHIASRPWRRRSPCWTCSDGFGKGIVATLIYRLSEDVLGDVFDRPPIAHRLVQVTLLVAYDTRSTVEPDVEHRFGLVHELLVGPLPLRLLERTS